MIKTIIAHHIVGVQDLFLCNFKNSTAFHHKVASSLICLPSLFLIKKSIKYGIIVIPRTKVAIQNEKICIIWSIKGKG
ncbi:MAG: hypothetical protein LBQ24_03870 [Candidatus Peribacteria bacterium]|nr:hypothetical protein [Candidatus Peribacteria bacterium]